VPLAITRSLAFAVPGAPLFIVAGSLRTVALNVHLFMLPVSGLFIPGPLPRDRLFMASVILFAACRTLGFLRCGLRLFALAIAMRPRPRVAGHSHSRGNSQQAKHATKESGGGYQSPPGGKSRMFAQANDHLLISADQPA
jgi:hypothetical protein